jgi:hypothetical protein
MFTKAEVPSPLEIEIDRALQELSHHHPDTEAYRNVIDMVVKLHAMKEEEKPRRISPDTIAIVATNLLGIVMVIKHENVNVISSKAMGLIQKPK